MARRKSRRTIWPGPKDQRREKQATRKETLKLTIHATTQLEPGPPPVPSSSTITVSSTFFSTGVAAKPKMVKIESICELGELDESELRRSCGWLSSEETPSGQKSPSFIPCWPVVISGGGYSNVVVICLADIARHKHEVAKALIPH